MKNLLSNKNLKNNKIFPFGPHICFKHLLLQLPVRIYLNVNYNRNIIGKDNRKRAIIYQ